MPRSRRESSLDVDGHFRNIMLAAIRRECIFRIMNATTHPDPPELRPQLHRLLDEIPDAELDVVRRLFLRLEARRLRTSLGQAVDDARGAGPLESDLVEQTLREYRTSHPYR